MVVTLCVSITQYIWKIVKVSSLSPQGLHSASVPGILALDVHQKDTSKIVTGGSDKNATVFNKDTEQVRYIYQKKYRDGS